MAGDAVRKCAIAIQRDTRPNDADMDACVIYDAVIDTFQYKNSWTPMDLSRMWYWTVSDWNFVEDGDTLLVGWFLAGALSQLPPHQGLPVCSAKLMESTDWVHLLSEPIDRRTQT